jgi:hypothetical protein
MTQNNIIWLLTVILYTPILLQLYSLRWEMIDYTHAYFILPVSLWLVFRKRKRLKDIADHATPKGSFLSYSLFVSGVLMFVFGWRHGYLFISTLSLLPVLCGLILILWGKKMK